MSGDALVGAVRAINPLAPQPVDQLGTPFLLFAADIDAQGEGDPRCAPTPINCGRR